MVRSHTHGWIACVLLFGLLTPAALTAQSCDFDTALGCGISDLNAMLALGPLATGVSVTHENQQYDLTGDDVIDNNDLAAWLVEAGTTNVGGPYLPGDDNLEGLVDETDFDTWIGDRFTETLLWDAGDFNGDGINDGQDFILWNENKFTSSDGVSAVPEPDMRALIMVMLIGMIVVRRYAHFI
jgi:hypothetical protein